MNHPPLEDKFKHIKPNRRGDQPSKNAVKESLLVYLTIYAMGPKHNRIDNRCSQPNTKTQTDQKKRLVEQSLSSLQWRLFGKGFVVAPLVQVVPNRSLVNQD